MWSSTQVPHYLQRELARGLGLDVARVRVLQPAVGGAFGGKSEPFESACDAFVTGLTAKEIQATRNT